MRLAAAIVVLVAAPALAAERNVAVGSFDKLAVAVPADVAVATGRGGSVRVSGAEADLDRLDIRVDGSTLTIGSTPGIDWRWRSGAKVRIAVTVPMLRAVDLAGSGGIVVDRIRTPDFAASLAGSGAVRVGAVDARTVKLSSSGSGTIEAAGRCGAGRAEIAGSGGIRIAGLKCATLSASVAGSGTIDAYATQTATLATMGSGDINVAGGARCTVSSAGSGRAHCS